MGRTGPVGGTRGAHGGRTDRRLRESPRAARFRQGERGRFEAGWRLNGSPERKGSPDADAGPAELWAPAPNTVRFPDKEEAPVSGQDGCVSATTEKQIFPHLDPVKMSLSRGRES